MAVYIEVVFIDNFVIDYIILSVCGMREHLRVLWWRKVLASLVGVAVAVLAVMELAVNMLALKVLGSFAMVAIAFGVKGFWKMLFNFYFFTFAIGGVAMGVLYLKEDVCATLLEPFSRVPTGVIFGLVFCGYIAVKRIIYIHNERKAELKFRYTVKMENRGRTFEGVAFLDSGNSLVFRDDLRGVCVGEYRKFARFFMGQKPRGQVVANTATESGMLYVYNVEKMLIDCGNGKNFELENICFALSGCDIGEADMLFPSMIFG